MQEARLAYWWLAGVAAIALGVALFWIGIHERVNGETAVDWGVNMVLSFALQVMAIYSFQRARKGN